MEAVDMNRRLRVQGPRSTRGCLSCKLRHLKCDETIPICHRCARSKRTCHYGTAQSNAPDIRFVVYTLPMEIDTTLNISLVERHDIWRFQNHPAVQIQGPFASKLWSSIIPQLLQDNSIVQQAVLALIHLHGHYVGQTLRSHSQGCDALHYYRNARQHIIDLESPDKSFDAILCACIIFSHCDGLRGEFQQATQHAIAGMKILAARDSVARNDASIFGSIPGALPEVFLDLQTQVIESNVSHFEFEWSALEYNVGEMPLQFRTAEEALPHLRMLSDSIMRLFRDAENYHNTRIWISSQISPELAPQFDAICAKYASWTEAMSYLKNIAPNRDQRQHLGRLLLQIKAILLEIDLHVFMYGEAAYDDCQAKQIEVLKLVEAFLPLSAHPTNTRIQAANSGEPLASASQHALFTASPEIIPVLFEIATRTREAWLHQAAVRLLRSTNRRENIWDSLAAANLAESIVNLKKEGSIKASKFLVPHKFLITGIQLRSKYDCLVQYGFKEVRKGSFESFWFETISPDQGTLESSMLNISGNSIPAVP